VIVPLIKVEALAHVGDARMKLMSVTADDLVIFTSATAVRATIAAVPGLVKRPMRAVAVGLVTARALASAGLPCDIAATGGGAEGIAAALVDVELNGRRCLMPQAEGARPFLAAWLRERGAQVITLPLYRTVTDMDAGPALRAALTDAVDVITFASPSAVTAFITLAGPSAPAQLIACIGETTADAARAAGLPVAVVSSQPTAQALAQAVAQHR
jgi:uroporphyrinogen-III synthase